MSSPASADELGDGAKQTGPARMILVGEHRVTLEIIGIADLRALAKRILEIAGPRIRRVESRI